MIRCETFWACVFVVLFFEGSATTHAQLSESARLVPFGQAAPSFGQDVAVWSDKAAVSAVDERAVFTYRRTSYGWTPDTVIRPQDGHSWDGFGRRIALYSDLLAIGAPDQNDDRGAVYVYTRGSGNWELHSKIASPDLSGDAQFGWDLDMNGTRLAVGAPLAGSDDRGLVYVYSLSGGNWTLESTLQDANPDDSEMFGYSVAIYNDRLLAGNIGDYAHFCGSASIYRRSGTTWSLEQKLLPPTCAGWTSQFGFRVALFEDTALIGTNVRSGFVSERPATLFRLSSQSWSDDTILRPATLPSDLVYAADVAMHDDLALVGDAWGFVYAFDTSLAGVVPSQALTSSDGAGMGFGGSVDIHNGTAIIGHEALAAAYVYELEPVIPQPRRKYVALGDSFSAGDSPQSSAPPCERSDIAYPNLVSDDLRLLPAERSFQACSGATTEDFYRPRGEQEYLDCREDCEQGLCALPPWSNDSDCVAACNSSCAVSGEEAQLEYLTSDADYVSFTIGGNDAKFSRTLKHCLAEPYCHLLPWVTNQVQDALRRLNGETQSPANIKPLRELYHDIRQKAEAATIIAIGYPRLYPAHSGQTCHGGDIYEIDVGISEAEQNWLNSVADELNRIVCTAARSNRVHFADTTEAFEGHQFCDGFEDEWFYAIRDGLWDYAFHPTAEGHRAIADAVGRVLEYGSDKPEWCRSRDVSRMVASLETVVVEVAVAAGRTGITFVSDWAGSDVITTLQSPSGRIIGRGNESPDVMHEVHPTWERYRISDPEAGTWLVSLFGADVPESGEEVTVMIHEEEPPNARPVAAINWRIQDNSIRLDGADSSDADGQIASYRWYVATADNESVADGNPLEFPLSTRGPHTITLRVTDDRGLTDFAGMMVLATDVNPSVPVSEIDPENTAPLSVAMLSSSDLNATAAIDVTTLRLGPAQAEPIHVDHEDVDGDGRLDLVAQFVTANAEFAAGQDRACVTGTSVDGLPFEGCDVVNVLANVAPVVAATAAAQDLQYSDPIEMVTITASDVVSDVLTAATSWGPCGGAMESGLPTGLSLVDNGCSATGARNSCVWALSGNARVPAGCYVVRMTVADDDGDSTEAETALNVSAEDAGIDFDGSNAVSVKVASAGGNSGGFQLLVTVCETTPDHSSVQPAKPGEISLASALMTLMPVGPGGAVVGQCVPAGVVGSNYDAVLSVRCQFANVPVNTYSVDVTVGGGYYNGSGSDVLVVYDPSLGFTTGGGWFFWPGSADPGTGYPGDRTNVGYTMKYNRSRTMVQGGLLLIRHLADDSVYRIKSNSLYGLALGTVSGQNPFGWASFSGKATYAEPGWVEPVGNYEFLVYVEDRNEPGNGNDRFWLRTLGRNGVVETDLSMSSPATDTAIAIEGGNIVVPHR